MKLHKPSAPTTSVTVRCGLPGARVGVAYDFTLSPPAGYRILRVELPPDCPFAIDRDMPLRISGVALETGQYSVSVVLEDSLRKVVTTNEILNVAADPRSLWKDLSPDPSVLGAKPINKSHSIATDDYCVLGASIRGRAHANKGEHREDDIELTATGDGGVAFAVADGAGSAALSRLASQVVVHAAIEVLRNSHRAETDSELAERLTGAALKGLEALAATVKVHDLSMDDLATTLLLGVCEGGDRPRIATLQVGDGAMAMRTGDNVSLLAAGEHGEFAGQTNFLHTAVKEDMHFAARALVKPLPAFDWIIIATDGVTDPFVEIPQEATAASAWSAIEKIGEVMIKSATPALSEDVLVNELGVFTPGYHDDRSIIIITPLTGRGSDE